MVLNASISFFLINRFVATEDAVSVAVQDHQAHAADGDMLHSM
jgi:hypothetical protein